MFSPPRDGGDKGGKSPVPRHLLHSAHFSIFRIDFIGNFSNVTATTARARVIVCTQIEFPPCDTVRLPRTDRTSFIFRSQNLHGARSPHPHQTSDIHRDCSFATRVSYPVPCRARRQYYAKSVDRQISRVLVNSALFTTLLRHRVRPFRPLVVVVGEGVSAGRYFRSLWLPRFPRSSSCFMHTD